MAHSLEYSPGQYRQFDTKKYLDLFYTTLETSQKDDCVTYFLNHRHIFWTTVFKPSVAGKEISCLEFGGGPVVSNLISAAAKVDRIVFCEFAASNREAVTRWVEGHPEEHDWMPFMRYTVETLEGNKTENAARVRQDVLKRKLSSVVPCDVSETPMVDFDHVDVGKLFDVVSTNLCLEVCVKSAEEYRCVVSNLGTLVKPNGYLIMSGVLEQTFYRLGAEEFYCFPLTQRLVIDAMQNAGFVDIDITLLEPKLGICDETAKALYFLSGKKAQ